MSKIGFFTRKKHYLPRISRLFSVRPFFWIISGLIFGIVASFLLWNPPFFTNIFSRPSGFHFGMSKDNSTLLQSYDQWKQIIEEKPEYRDGYVMFAWYAQELGKTGEAKIALQKAQSLDPNYPIPEVLQMEGSFDSAGDK